MKFILFSIGSGLFPANTLIPLLRLHSLAFDFETFASQKTELPRLTTVCPGKPGTDALRNISGIVHLFRRSLSALFPLKGCL